MSDAKARVVRIATRASELALRQARLVASALEERDVQSEIVTFKTTGDKKLTEPLSEIGAKGLFTHELEVALAKKKVDCCVHSLKDLPTESPAGLEIVAQLQREDPRDVLVVNRVLQADSLASVPSGSRIGTSSLRRRAQLLSLRPDLEVVDLRGNVPTRLTKVESGQVHAAILAAAGLIRLNARARITAFLEPPEWLPAAGQGAIAIQIRSDDDEMRSLMTALNDSATSLATNAERAFLAALDGGCQVPIGALTWRDASGALMLHGFVSDLRGKNFVRGSVRVSEANPVKSGEDLAAELRSRGAASLLTELRATENVTPPQPE
ncbi:MAG TPA: hydroxymethylbilane synthase [Gemmatimonadaceae bacterium]|nr:hydroxymethylbilane synthase [Gemmatimonadaceae bacterium]